MVRVRSARSGIRVLVLAAALAVAAGCRVERHGADRARDQNLYQTALGDPKTFNPILATDGSSGEFVGNLFSGLVRDNPKTLRPEPDLAESWDISPDQKTITFHLRRDVKWFDGEPFTAHDVLFTFNVIYDPNVANIIQPSVLVDGKRLAVEAVDDYTVRITMPRVFAPLLYSIGIPIMPAHVLEPIWKAGKFNQAWGVNTPVDQLIGTGGLKMARYVPAQIASYVRNDNYWMKDDHGAQLPYLRKQTLMIVPDLNAAYLRFLGGQTDIYAPRPEQVADLKEKSAQLGIKVAEMGVDTGSLFFCFNRNPSHYVKNAVADPKLGWFTDINFLRAVAHAVDKDSIINLVYHGLAVPAISDITSENHIFYNPNLKDYDYDLSEAAKILDAAGYQLARPGVRTDPKGHPLEFNLVTNTGVNERDRICAIFLQDMAKLGIKVNYRPLEFTTLVEKLDTSHDWDCVLIGFTGTIEPNNGADVLRSSGHLHMWNPDQKTPATPWEAEIDKLLDQGTTVIDPAARAPYYWKIQEIIHAQLPMIQTVRARRFTAYRNKLENYVALVWGTYRPELIRFRQD
jgi:peptide/nickel transport system substrate-binding protein